jgi:hypothetical protein
MYRHISIFAILLIFVSCSQKPEKAILGKWENSNETMEFFKDNSFITSSLLMSGGKYIFVDDNRIKFDFGGLGAFAGPIVVNISISQDKLIITMPDGTVMKYNRTKKIKNVKTKAKTNDISNKKDVKDMTPKEDVYQKELTSFKYIILYKYPKQIDLNLTKPDDMFLLSLNLSLDIRTNSLDEFDNTLKNIGIDKNDFNKLIPSLADEITNYFSMKTRKDLTNTSKVHVDGVNIDANSMYIKKIREDLKIKLNEKYNTDIIYDVILVNLKVY